MKLLWSVCAHVAIAGLVGGRPAAAPTRRWEWRQARAATTGRQARRAPRARAKARRKAAPEPAARVNGGDRGGVRRHQDADHPDSELL